MTAAYGESESPRTFLGGRRVAARVGAALRIASFAVWSRPAYTTRLGTDSEDMSSRVGRDREARNAALEQVGALPNVPGLCRP